MPDDLNDAEKDTSALNEYLADDNAGPFEPTPEGYEAIELAAERKNRQESNQRKVQLLASAGVDVGPALISCRLETLIEWAVGGEDTAQRKDFDAEYEDKLTPMLDSIATQVRQQLIARDAQAGAKLLQGNGQPLRSV